MPNNLANAAAAWSPSEVSDDTVRHATPALPEVHLPTGHIEVGVVVRERPGIQVCEARQPSLAREVTVQRVLDPTHVPSTRRLIQEAQRTASLDHPHILPVHDLVQHGNAGPMVVLPHVPGRTWADRISSPHGVRAHFGATDLLVWHAQILLKVARAIAYAHSQHVLHRDLKPANIWVGDLGEVYVIHWGLGMTFAEAERFAPSMNSVTGSPAYMAPELVVATAGNVGPRTDIYQLGGMLYELLTGLPPHRGDSFPEIVRNLLFRVPALPSDVPASLARVCKKALARNPGARHPTVDDFIDDLEIALAERTAWSLAKEADAHLDEMQRLVRRKDSVDRATVHLTFGACRMGYQHALNVAPNLPSARMRLQRAMDLVVQWELDQGRADVAAELLAELDDVPNDLLQRILDAQVDEDRDDTPHPTQHLAPVRDTTRRWVGAGIALVVVPAPLVLALIPAGTYTLPLWMAMGAALTMVAVAARAALSRRAPDATAAHNLLRWASWTPALLTILTTVAWVADVPADTARALLSLGAFLLAGTATYTLDWRLVVVAVGYGLTWLVAVQHPHAWVGAMLCTNLLLCLVLLRAEPTQGGTP